MDKPTTEFTKVHSKSRPRASVSSVFRVYFAVGAILSALGCLAMIRSLILS